MERIYLDHAATTKLRSEALQKMMPYLTDVFGNANSQHSFGRDAMSAVDEARDGIAKLIHAKPSEVYFTSGGTEADNWALKGIVRAMQDKGKHFIVSAIEHPAVLESAKMLEKEGYECTVLPVTGEGLVQAETLRSALRSDTTVVCVMLANNEIGTVEPVKELAEIAHENGSLFFTDAVQAIPAIDVDVQALGVDAMSFSSHKFGGPKGMGALYLKSGTPAENLLSGGHQERMRRGGTTNVAGVVGMAEALRVTAQNRRGDTEKIKDLRDYFVERVKKEIPNVLYNGSVENRVVGNASFSFKNIEAESILFRLDLAGIAVSSGSACSSGSLEASHVILAIGRTEGEAHGTVRFSFGAENTREETDYVVDTLKRIVSDLRK